MNSVMLALAGLVVAVWSYWGLPRWLRRLRRNVVPSRLGTFDSVVASPGLKVFRALLVCAGLALIVLAVSAHVSK